MVIIIFSILVVLLLVGCEDKNNKEYCKTLFVDLDSIEADVNDVFSKIEIIPLETTDSSFVVYPKEIQIFEDIIYIYDIDRQKVFSFNMDGKFIRNIGRMGNGPGEYSWLSSISIDEKRERIQLLTAFSTILEYTTSGCFIEKRFLPHDKLNYQALFNVNDYIVTWTIPHNNETDCISILDSGTLELVKQFVKGASIVKKYSRNLYSYNNDIYYGQTIENSNVYKISKDTIGLAYRWDFGSNNYNMHDFNLTYKNKNINEEEELLRNYINEGIVPYWQVKYAENDKYYYTCLRFNNKRDVNIFYRKTDGRYFILGNKQDLKIFPRLFTEEYMMSVVSHQNRNIYKSILPASEYQKLESMKEDDNPCLLKLYFK